MPEYVTGSEENSGYPDLPKATREYLREGAAVGSRDNSLFGAACQFRDGGYSQADAEGPLIDRAVRDGLSEAYAKRKIASAYSQPPRGSANNAHASGTAPPPQQSKASSASASVLPPPIADGFRILLETCFLEGEGVAIGRGRIEDGDLKIDGGSVLRRERWLAKGSPPINKTEEGVFVRVNPLRSGGKADKDVTAYRHGLVEFDRAADGKLVPKEAQYQALIESGFPISAIIDGGNISLQALVRFDAGNPREFDERWKLVADHFQNVEGFDPSTKNPSRYCRLPGVTRRIEGGAIGHQELLAVRIGPTSWQEWQQAHQQDSSTTEFSDEDLQRMTAEQMAFYRLIDRPLPAPMDTAAFHGLAGEVTELMAAGTEACPESLLSQFLVGFGNILGRNLYCEHGGIHYLNEFIVLVGQSSTGRKGTSWTEVTTLFTHLDLDWLANRVRDGFQSGESIIDAIRDPRKKLTRSGKTVFDPGVTDKRLLVFEDEFGRLLVVADRQQNTLSFVLRKFWDSPNWVHAVSKTDPEKVSHPHVSLIGHITPTELLERLNQVDTRNGFANRILWLAVNRAKEMDSPVAVDWKKHPALIKRLNDVIATFRTGPQRLLGWEPKAKTLWRDYYLAKKSTDQGLIGPIIKRSPSHVLRLTGIYAALDHVTLIKTEHLQAAIAHVDYCERSAGWAFMEKTGNKAADRIYWALVRHPKGMTRQQIQEDVFSKHCPKTTLDIALSHLMAAGLANLVLERHPKTNRPIERWITENDIATSQKSQPQGVMSL